MRTISALLLLLICISSSAADKESGNTAPVDGLILELRGIDALQGSFSQQLYDSEGKLLLESSGHFSLLRPGFFSWDILTPDNQLIIANPDFLWHYDRDLETATRRPANAEENLAPLQILGGDDAALRQHFAVEGGAGEYTLRPLQGNAGFQVLRLIIGALGPQRMEIDDNLQQKVIIQFQNTQRGANLTAADFSFSPPPDADVFYYDE